MKQTTLLFILLIGLIQIPKNGFAQKKTSPEFYGVDSDSVSIPSYTVIRNRPDSIYRLNLRLYPLNAIYFTGQQETAIFPLNFDYDITKKWSAFALASLCQTYAYTITDQFSPNLKTGYQFELGGQYNIINTQRNKRQALSFLQKNHGHVYAKIPDKLVFRLGLRASFNVSNINISAYQVKFNVYNVNNPSARSTSIQNYDFYYDSYSNTQIEWLSLGIDADIIKDFLIKIENVPLRKKMSKNRIYADFLVSPYSRYGNIIIPINDTDSKKLITLDADKCSPKQNLGFRIGYEHIGLRRIGFTWGLEAGMMPLLGQYFTFKLGATGNFIAKRVSD